MVRGLWIAGSCIFALAADGALHGQLQPDRAPGPATETAQPLDDSRVELRTLRDEYHPWTPPATRAEWELEAERIRRQVLVGIGLWPMPPKTPLNPVIHGRVERDDYTVERVTFESLPGLLVTGSLYRPKRREGPLPAVLSPHGHWRNGRFYDAGEAAAAAQLEQGAEQLPSAARYPLQARMVHLARMGCVVFHYDMLGYADSRQLEHRQGFSDVESVLRLQSIMGLQTWNSIRALDFLTALPDVDPERIAVTGASGGGTQTFMLGAVDPRPAVAFPAVMVSTNMQGGCVCENAPYLRLGLNNVALAALFAPKPLAMSGADDWTIDIETKGLPELKRVFSLYGKANLVHARAYPQFKHNYNQVSRKLMYEWLNKHLHLGVETPIAERDFEPLTQQDMTVFDDEHPRPENSRSLTDVKRYLTQVAERQYAELIPREVEELDKYREVVGVAAGVLLDHGVPAEVEVEQIDAKQQGDVRIVRQRIGRADKGESVPVIAISHTDGDDGPRVVWIDGRGKRALFDEQGEPIAAVQRLLARGATVVSADVFQTGEYRAGQEPLTGQPVDDNYCGYTFAYNRPLLQNRVRDVLTVIGSLGERRPVRLIGSGEAGMWVLLAAAVAGPRVERVIADLGRDRFGDLAQVDDPLLLPGALKYGGLGGLAALAAPTRLELWVENLRELEPLVSVYTAAAAPLTLHAGPVDPPQLAERIVAE